METDGGPDHIGADGDLLFDVATPQLYRMNAFRVLGLSVTADGVEMNRQQKKLKMLKKLGAALSSESASVLRIDPPPNADTIRRAGQRLHDMRTRLVDELFWFWPLNCDSLKKDAAFELLEKGDVGGAYRIWSATSRDPQNASVANHNLAVLHHTLALDLEEKATQAGRASDKREALLRKHWPLALKYWASTANDEGIWARLADRASDLDDPRLTTGFVRRLRQSLPAAILNINIGFAVRSAKRGDAEHAGR